MVAYGDLWSPYEAASPHERITVSGNPYRILGRSFQQVEQKKTSTEDNVYRTSGNTHIRVHNMITK